eukprot:TRINITY_DN8009_c0_g1::TRINITY_DN8009_c0_g1_i1::g.15614::m.15614 TRINITY_DN8009_c0_g1::TRINITY_DN8009_c0_g1_i1::g.15614  ORF type:complete len:365 (-),score=127.54,sp/Q9ZRF1/MTDH_FRAAN/59.36/1e-132,ADH_N/PF08240.7/3e-29,ADH_zinc_N/PF00107.21/8.3e-21,NAD_binding_2/PF03446.10/0.0072,3HCDH_N/PF02737.13/0.013,2-Hacid_dh_C/PF02826.14/0.014,NAD_binding_10/PF13460.1/0.037,DUF4451/PF14616.1/0.12,NAD_binding_7/PF13241.1/0.19,Shikimate_DH/PF01488.15/0.3,AlaDh_PNT_C/PF01262.16/5e+03,AlaDh_PNT_C/PF01262.16/0
MPNTSAYAALDSTGHLVPFEFDRRPVGDDDVRIEIKYAGICHSDYHQIKNEWHGSSYPMVPGHEIAGVVTEVGPKVTKFKLGDHVGVGCMVDSCGSCDACHDHTEQFCPTCSFTYNSKDKHGVTHGGYSTQVVVRENFVVRIPDNLPLDAAAPLLCAGITTYSPIMYYGVKPGQNVAVLGLGGLGHMGVKFLVALGCTVTVISTSPSKKEEAMTRLGAHHFLLSTDSAAMKNAVGTFHAILDTVSAPHDMETFLNLLKPNGKMLLVGAPPEPYKISGSTLFMKRRLIGGSLIGGVKETQEMMDFCGKHNIVSDIEKINIDYVNTAMERLVKSDVKYRFVIDIESLRKKN